MVVESHRLGGVYLAKGGKDDALVTRNLDAGRSVYGEKRISVESGGSDGSKVEYRVWNPFRSKLAAAIVGGVENVYIGPGQRVLYLGAANGTTVSHVSDIVGAGREWCTRWSSALARAAILVNMAKRRMNVVPIVEDARYPLKYRLLIGCGLVDVIFADVAQPDQARIVELNATTLPQDRAATSSCPSKPTGQHSNSAHSTSTLEHNTTQHSTVLMLSTTVPGRLSLRDCLSLPLCHAVVCCVPQY